MHIRKWVVYDLDSRTLTADDRIGDLVEILIGICEANPEFLDPVDAKRHAFFLRALSGFNPADFDIRCFSHDSGKPVSKAGDLPIKALPGLLEYWVLCYFDLSQLLPHYALDTSEFLLAIAYGIRRWEPHPWRIDPLVEKEPRFGTFDSSFRASFTRRGGGSILVGTVPDGTNVVGQYFISPRGREQTVEVASRAQFAFRVKRCHLSDPWGDYPCRLRIEPKPKSVELGDDFRFVGNIRPLLDESNHINQDWDWDDRGYFDLPHLWITHEVCVNEENRWNLRPLPAWETPIEEPPSPLIVAHSHATRVRDRVQGTIRKKVGAYPVPATPTCSVCGVEISPAMLVWRPEQRFCTPCKRAKRTDS